MMNFIYNFLREETVLKTIINFDTLYNVIKLYTIAYFHICLKNVHYLKAFM